MITTCLSVTDDSGFLAIIDPDAYSGFVSSDWELSDVLAKFLQQMALRTLLIWGTGGENTWSVSIGLSGRLARCFRSCEGSITASRGRLLLTNYESLTMAAQFEDVALPEAHHRDLILDVEPGTYWCRVAQLRAPETSSNGGPDFAIQLDASRPPVPAWRVVPWCNLSLGKGR